ncbi:L,D-transpeptidase [Streptomyces sp. NPDC002788]
MRSLKNGMAVALLATAVLAGASGCDGSAAASVSHAAAHSSPEPRTSVSPSPTHPPMLLDSIVPEPGGTVGVAMPVSVVFTDPVASSARATVERHLKVSTSVPVTGAWHWFSSTRVDWRPRTYWPSGTKVTLNAGLKDVSDGFGRYGLRDYRHSFTIGPDVETTVSVPGHWMKVTRDGRLVRTMPIDAGSPTFPSWDGTMAVIDKEPKVRMTSCSVGITCDKHNPDYYDLNLPWDVHLTTSGTYVHYSTGDPHPGHGYGSHGCVHLSLSEAKWFYHYVEQGDPVTITGSPRGNAAGDNGYADFNLPWSQWLSASATGPRTTSRV